MDSLQLTRTIRGLLVAALVGSVGAIAWGLATLRREAATRVAWAPLWPRPDGSVRSFGEVWDHPDPSDAAAG